MPHLNHRPLTPRNRLAHSISLLLAGLVHLPANAAPSIDGQTIHTTVETAPAVTVAAGDTLDVSNSTVSTEGKGADALAAQGTLTGSNLTLQTQGNTASAAIASNGGAVNLTQTHITTQGNGALGLHASGNGSVIKYGNGDITTHGGNGYGTYSENGGRVELNSVTLSTTGNTAVGISIYQGGSAQVSGSVLSTLGKEAHGALLMGQDATHQALAVISNSQIVTQGLFAIGINVNDNALATVTNSAITTGGEDADGIWLTGPSTAADLKVVNITTSGDGANGISNQGGAAMLQDVTIVTHGNQAHGLYSEGDTATITAHNTHITLDQFGAGAFAVDGGTITLDGGTVNSHKGGIGLLAASKGELSAAHLMVTAEDAGARALMLSDGGQLTADDVRATVTGAGSSGLLASASSVASLNQASLKNTSVTALNSTAIAVRGGQLDLALENANLQGQQLLDVDVNTLANGSTVAYGTVDISALNSTLRGDIRVSGAATGAAALHLQDSSLTGAVQGLDQLELLGTSHWAMTATSRLGDLNNQGTVAFQPGTGFKTLTVADLSGSGTFVMNTDLATQQGDLLQVQGTHSGSHRLAIADSGHEPAAANGELMLVDGNGGAGTFALAGRPYVDAGAFRYSLQQDGDDWFLRNTAQAPGSQEDNLSDGANTALGNQTAAATLWSAEMNALVKRLGELRMGHDNGGVWTRGIGKTYKVDTAHSRSFEQSVHGLEIGADTAIPLSGSKLYVGGMLGAAKSTQNYSGGADGKIDSQLLGAYATWLDDAGYYVDSVAKYNRMKNEVKNQANTGEQIKGDYNTRGYAADLEVGRHITLGDGWFIEPQAEVTYTHTAGARYTASNGLRVSTSDTESLQGRLGSLLGKNLTLGKGMAAQPYVKASYVHEFAGESSVTVNGHKLTNQIAGSRGEIGLGGVLQVSEKTKVALDIQHADGDQVEEPWAINLGMRYLW